MTLVGIGKRIGLSTAGVSDIKQGRTKAPTGMVAVRLHDLHGDLVRAGKAVTAAANDEASNLPEPCGEVSHGVG